MLAALLLLAAPAADPLARIPAGYTFAATVPNPRAAVEAFRTLDAVSAAAQLAEVKEALAAGPARKLADLMAVYERDLGAGWPELLEKVAGNGVAVAAMFGQDDGPAVVAVEGTDADAVGRFFASALKLLESSGDEDNPVSLKRGTHAGADTATDGKGFFAARRGPTMWVSNKADALKAALDLKGPSLAPAAAPARKLAGGDPLLWAWLDLKTLKQTQASKDFFASTRQDFLQTVVLGASIDAARADFVAAALHRTPAGAKLDIRFPANRADLPAEFTLHVPPSGPGSLPLLNPPGTLYSQSFHLDIGTLWRERAKLINGQQLADIEKADKDISKILPGTTLGKLLEMSGPHHRIVVADVPGDAYTTLPVTPTPAAAVVLTMRDAQFGKTMASALRAGAFAASIQYKLKMSTQDIDGVPVVCYRFPEDKPFPDDADPDRLRFNAVPCFAVVGEHLIVATRPELVRALLPELKKAAGASPAVWRGRFDLGGLAAFLDRHPEPVVSRGLLGQGLTLAEAKARAAEGVKWLATLGGVELTLDHQTEAYVISFAWTQR